MMNSFLWRLTTLRRTVFEGLGSERFSRPAYAGIEEKLLAYLPEPGFFIEAGALDGFFESNTYYLERFRGWRGILVEPSPAMFARLAVNRPRAQAFHCALVGAGYGQPTIRLVDAHAVSAVDPAATGAAQQTIDVPARTLQSILEEARPPAIDLFSLDVEGYEVEVLKGLDLDRFSPRYLLVECLDEAHKASVEGHLAGRYEQVDALSDRDMLYRRRPA